MKTKVHPLHILVQHRHEAEDILRLLDRARDKATAFTELARKHSNCSSGPLGGDLGIIEARRLDPDFLEALISLKPGQISAPIKTRFGWHLIKRAESSE